MKLSGRSTRTITCLDDIFGSADEFGLLAVKARVAVPGRGDLVASGLEEINQFIDTASRLPGEESEDITERRLARRLRSIAESADRSALLRFDRHNILVGLPLAPPPAVALEPVAGAFQDAGTGAKPTLAPEDAVSLDDIFGSDEWGLIDIDDASIFDLQHVPAVDRDNPDEVAQRTRCEDFWQFESVFKRLQTDLAGGVAEAIPFTMESQINAGDAFILQGVMCFVDSLGEDLSKSDRSNARLRLIFDNGTESNMLKRSLAAALYKDEHGRRILQDRDVLVDAFRGVTQKDKRSGMVYIVRTLSKNPELARYSELYKIGYTELSVENRTKNAVNDTAFLESHIQIVTAFECYNLNPHRFESLIHGFLAAQRLTIELIGRDGKAYHPREWFAVPLDTAKEVIKRIIDGTIVEFRMDNTSGRIVRKAPPGRP